MPTVLTDPIPLRVETTGDDRRPALVLINPLGTTLEFWQPMIDELSAHFWVVRFDIRGHGESAGEVNPYTIDDIANDVLVVMDALEIPRSHLFGSSFGGLVAATVAASHPERVDRLILAATALRLGSDEWWADLSSRINDAGLAAVVDHLDEIFFSEAWQLAVPDRLEAARAMFLDTPVDAYLAGIEAVLNSDLSSIIENIRAATLAIAGEGDPMFRYKPVTDLLERITDSEAVHVGGAKHRVLLEQPDALAQVVVDFLQDPDAR